MLDKSKFSKVTSDMEALEICKEFNMEVKFGNITLKGKKMNYVELSLNAWTKTIGRSLVEAVNRMSEMYNTPPVDYEKLSWWSEVVKFFVDGFNEEAIENRVDSLNITDENDFNVHASHCCALHGCKYGNDIDCPVYTGKINQKYICEYCSDEGFENLEELKKEIEKESLDLVLTQTERGFEILHFTDYYGDECSIQKSSIATTNALWIGISHPTPKIMASKTPQGGTGWVPFDIPEDVFISTRMHLTQRQIAQLLPILECYVNTGNFEI